MADATAPTLEHAPGVPPHAVEDTPAGEMPPWSKGELPDAPRFTARNWFALLGPGLLMGGASIGGGEWLMGPKVTAQFGPSLMWLATLSILGQVIYNVEISRYTLYTGEPIFTGKLRTRPGSRFWLVTYLILDFGALFPYLAASAAIPLLAIFLGIIPDPDVYPEHAPKVRAMGVAIFLLSMIPLVFGGKIYSTLKGLLTFKIVAVLGFLLFLALFHSSLRTWGELLLGLVQFGTVPIRDATLEAGLPPRTANIFASLWRGEGMPSIDLGTAYTLAAFAGIAGSGGLSNVVISNYTRDQGWGMGKHVGAIPSIVSGRKIALSHTGMVFDVTPDTLPRWRRWVRHVRRDQFAVWLPACVLGVLLPSILSAEYLPRGTIASDWNAAGMTANAASKHVGAAWGLGWGTFVWYAVLACGFLTLGPTTAATADGVVRRWVDVFWTASHRLRAWHERRIKYLYFSVLVGYALFGLLMLAVVPKPVVLLKIGVNLMNFALGFSCLHALYVNLKLLPRELRPGWPTRICLVLAALFFITLATIVATKMLSDAL
jgi:hypothetical protein